MTGVRETDDTGYPDFRGATISLVQLALILYVARRFVIHMTAALFLYFVQRLLRNAPRKVFLIVDRLRIHWGRLVPLYLQANGDRIEVSRLASYSPEYHLADPSSDTHVTWRRNACSHSPVVRRQDKNRNRNPSRGNVLGLHCSRYASRRE